MGQQEREKINLPEHTAGRSQNKGTEQVQRRARRLRTGPALPEAGGRRQGIGERGRLGPKDRSPYHTANRPPISNQRPPEILDGRHLSGGSRRDTGRRHPTSVGGDWGWRCRGQKAHAPDWRGWKLRLGPPRGEAAPHPGRVRRSSSWLPELLGQGRHKMQAQLFVLRFWELPRAGTARSAGHAPYRAAGSLSSVEGRATPAPPRSMTELAT